MFGERLKELREARGISQVQLARRLGKSKQSVSNWENNNILPSIEILIRLARIFCVSCDYLLGIDNQRFLDVNGLKDEELIHLQLIINDLRSKNTECK